jgi:hypothetical protein
MINNMKKFLNSYSRVLQITSVVIFSCLEGSFAYTQDIDITQQLASIEGLRFEETQSPAPGYRTFEMYFTQPADHKNPRGETFEQKLILWHKDASRPMTLQTSGYHIYAVGLSSLALAFNTNQIQVEHRFFLTSTPASKNWALDTIEQSANDFHRVTQAFKSIYKGKWVNTGRSKGGMTSVYHRRFFPNDLDATVAHVAPHSFSVHDERYETLVSDQIGGEENKVCRQKLVDSQKILLANKEKIAHELAGLEFTLVGSKEIASEHSVIEMPWTFWQYFSPIDDCANVPSVSDDVQKHLDFLTEINDPAGYSDAEAKTFVPYYYQAASQLGSPGTRLTDIMAGLSFPETFNIFTYVPKDIPVTYDNAEAMKDVSAWLKSDSERMIFVYGEWDPWSGGPFEPRAEGDSYRFYVPKTNHSSQVTDLKGEDHDLAYKKLRTWLNIQSEASDPSMSDKEIKSKSLEQMEFESVRVKL